MTLEFITDYINQKIRKNSNILIFTFYEIRIKCNLSKPDTERFLELAQTKLINLGYKVYLTGEKYKYADIENIVKENELMVAVKK